VSVQAQLGPPKARSCHFDEQRTKLGVINVEVVVVHVHGFVARLLDLPVDLLALEGLGLFLRHADEDHPVADAALLPHFVGDVSYVGTQAHHLPVLEEAKSAMNDRLFG
jgi:hypothetical protein